MKTRAGLYGVSRARAAVSEAKVLETASERHKKSLGQLLLLLLSHTYDAPSQNCKKIKATCSRRHSRHRMYIASRIERSVT